MSERPVVERCLTWRVVPLHTPRVLRACPRCGGARAFASSDRFRVNASGRRLDVWLVYRCVHCAFTWNLTVVERATPEAIGPAALAAYHRNDAARAWACAFDAALLRRAGARYEAGVPVRVERGPLPEGRAVVRLALVHPLRLRLHRLLAQELGLPRSRIAAVVEAPEALRRPVHDGQVVVMTATSSGSFTRHDPTAGRIP